MCVSFANNPALLAVYKEAVAKRDQAALDAVFDQYYFNKPRASKGDPAHLFYLVA